MPHVSSKKSSGVYLCEYAEHYYPWKHICLCYLCLPFRLAMPPGFHVTRIPKGNLVLLRTKFAFLALRYFFLFRLEVFSRSLSRGARRVPACTPQRKCEPQPRSVGRAMGLRSREFWQITKGRRSDLTRLDTASRLPCTTCRTTVFSPA